jgi:hypothetical protein
MKIVPVSVRLTEIGKEGIATLRREIFLCHGVDVGNLDMGDCQEAEVLPGQVLQLRFGLPSEPDAEVVVTLEREAWHSCLH